MKNAEPNAPQKTTTRKKKNKKKKKSPTKAPRVHTTHPPPRRNSPQNIATRINARSGQKKFGDMLQASVKKGSQIPEHGSASNVP